MDSFDSGMYMHIIYSQFTFRTRAFNPRIVLYMPPCCMGGVILPYLIHTRDYMLDSQLYDYILSHIMTIIAS